MNIQVCSRSDLRKLAKKPFESRTAVISITDSDAPPVTMENQPAYLLRLVFDDVYFGPDYEADDDMIFINFSKQQAVEIISFVKECREDVETIICQCEMGQSRSAAVAAALSEWLNGDGNRFFDDIRYSPNQHVFRLLNQTFKEGVDLLS